METYVRKGRPPVYKDPPQYHELRIMVPKPLAGFWFEWIREIDSTSSAEVRKLIAGKLREVGKIE
jgi:hypothetical protein